MKALRDSGRLPDAVRGCFETPRREEYLFDVEADPNCRNNLIDDPKYHPQRNALRAALQEWQQRTDDAFPGEDALTPDGFDRETGKRLIKAAHPSFQ